MISANPLHDQRIVDSCFHLLTTPGLRKAGWLFGMVSVYGKTPGNLKGFTWSNNNTIIITNKKRPVRPLHPEWVSLFQLKEKQPSKLESRWDEISNVLNEAIEKGVVNLTIPNLLIAYKMRKLVYAPVNRTLHSTCPTFSVL